MSDIESIYSELIGFLKNIIIEERFVEFENKDNNRTITSINNIYSLEVIKSIISCLFNKGRVNLIKHLEMDIEEGNIEFKDIHKTIFFQMGELNQVLKTIKLKNESKEKLIVEELRSSYDDQNFDLILKEILKAPSISSMVENIKECWTEEIDKTFEIESSLIINAGKNPYKNTFGLNNDFINKHAKDLYHVLSPKFIKCTEEDFISFCCGKHCKGKLDFKTQAELITFIKWLKENGFIINDNISWKYIVNQSTVNGCSINPDSLRKLYQGTNSADIMEELNIFLRHIKKRK